MRVLPSYVISNEKMKDTLSPLASFSTMNLLSWATCKYLFYLTNIRAKILVKPTLILNDRELADLRLLEKTKVTLQTVNKVDNITISKTYEDVKLTDQEEYEIEF